MRISYLFSGSIIFSKNDDPLYQLFKTGNLKRKTTGTFFSTSVVLTLFSPKKRILKKSALSTLRPN
jgi:hypothetical protein